MRWLVTPLFTSATLALLLTAPTDAHAVRAGSATLAPKAKTSKKIKQTPTSRRVRVALTSSRVGKRPVKRGNVAPVAKTTSQPLAQKQKVGEQGEQWAKKRRKKRRKRRGKSRSKTGKKKKKKCKKGLFNKIKCGFKKVGKGLKKGFKKVGKGLGKVGKAVGGVLFGPIKMIIKIVKTLGKFVKLVGKHGFGGAVKHLWKQFKAKVKREVKYMKSQFKKLFTGFRQVLVMKKFELKRIERFARTVTKTAKNMVSRFNRMLGIPKLIATLIGWMAAAPLYPTTLAAVTPLAAINFGFRKLMSIIIPKIILGAGGAFNSARYSKAGKLFGKIAKGLLKVAGVGGGLLMGFVKNPQTKERIKRLFISIANVSGKLEAGINSAMTIVKQVRDATFDQVDSALSRARPVDAKLNKQDFVRLVGGLMDFANEQIWLKLSPILRKVLTKALSAMDRLIDIPRNAIVSGIGSVPFVGGVLAAAVNFGLGILIDMVKNLFIDGIMKMANTLLNDTLNDIKKSVQAKLMRSKNVGKRGSGFLSLINSVGKLAGEVKTQMRRASQGIQGTISGVVATALDKFLLRGIADANLRQIISKGVSFVLGKITAAMNGRKSGGFKFSLTDAAIKVLRYIKSPLSNFIASKVKNRDLRAVVSSGFNSLIDRLANKSGIRQLMKNPAGFLGELGAQFFRQNKTRLISLLTKGKTFLRQVVTMVVDGVEDIVRRKGIRGLIEANELIGLVLTMTQSLAIERIPEPFRGIVQKAFDKVAPKLRTAEGRRWLVREGPRALWRGLVDYLKNLYKRAKSFVRSKVDEVKAAIFETITTLQGSLTDIRGLVSQLTNLGSLLRGARLPGI